MRVRRKGGNRTPYSTLAGTRRSIGYALPADTNPLAHYVKIGSKAALSPHPLFDARAYLNDNPDVAKAGCDPLSHFLIHGGREGRNPHKLFQVNWYLDQNPHVAGGLEMPWSTTSPKAPSKAAIRTLYSTTTGTLSSIQSLGSHRWRITWQ